MPNDAPKIEFVCSIPPLKSAFQADNDVVRVVFEIPRTNREQAMRLAGMFDKALWVTVEEH